MVDIGVSFSFLLKSRVFRDLEVREDSGRGLSVNCSFGKHAGFTPVFRIFGKFSAEKGQKRPAQKAL
jgi:hypothetical protein